MDAIALSFLPFQDTHHLSFSYLKPYCGCGNIYAPAGRLPPCSWARSPSRSTTSGALTKTSRQLVFRGGQILATGGGDTFGACNRPVGVHVDPNDSIHLL